MQNDKGIKLLNHGGIYIMELGNFHKKTKTHNDLERWLQFLIEAENINDKALPRWMQTKEMRQAMTTLKRFSDKEIAYERYQARQDYLREQRSIQLDLEQANLEATQAKEREMQALNEKQQALEEINRLKALLKHKK